MRYMVRKASNLQVPVREENVVRSVSLQVPVREATESTAETSYATRVIQREAHAKVNFSYPYLKRGVVTSNKRRQHTYPTHRAVHS